VEQVINIAAKTWIDVRSLAQFIDPIAFNIYNDDNQIVRIATQIVKPTTRDAGIPTYVKQFTRIPVDVGVWAYSGKATTLIVQWDSDSIVIPEVSLVGAEISILNSKIDDLIQIQSGMLSLLEAAFEDGISGRTLNDGEC